MLQMLIFAIRAWKGLRAAWQREGHTESFGGNTADVGEQHQARETAPRLVTLHH